MKRADLSPGLDVLVSDRRDWQRAGYAAQRFRIVDTGYWMPASLYRRDPDEVVLADGRTYAVTGAKVGAGYSPSAGVLAIRLERDGEPRLAPSDANPNPLPRAVVLSLASIRGPWEEAAAEIGRVESAEQASRLALEAERRQRLDRASSLAQRLATVVDGSVAVGAALSGRPVVQVGREGGYVLNEAAVLALLDRLEA